MSRKLQVFVSSTYLDLKTERQAAVEAILRSKHIPAGMELFTAGSEEQLKVIYRWIDDSDVYMLILGGRYGTIHESKGKSYTQLEYEYAVKKGMPLFAVYMTDDYLNSRVMTAGKDVLELKNQTGFTAFKTTVMSKMCMPFSSLDTLKLAVMQSLGEFDSDKSLVGWVRGDQVANTGPALEQLAKLQADNETMRKELEQLRNLSAEEPPLRDLLSEEARSLLLSIGGDENGIILVVRGMGGTVIQTNGSEVCDPSNRRDIAKCQAAITELSDRGLIQDMGYKGETFELTNLGYKLVDELNNLAKAAPTVNP